MCGISLFLIGSWRLFVGLWRFMISCLTSLMGFVSMGRPLSAPQSLEMGFHVHHRVYKNLMLWRNAVLNQDIDCCIIIDGNEGSGKSVLGMQLAAVLDIDHHLDLDKQICLTPDQFKEAVGSLKKGKAIVWDEARRGANRRRHADEVNLEITDMLAECRQHNLFLVIIAPAFYDLDMNISVFRSRILCHVWYDWDLENKEKPLRRGFYRLYNEDGKKGLYTNKHLRQSYRYPYVPNNSFDATFGNHYVVDEEDYRARKKESEKYYRRKNNPAGPIILRTLKDKDMLKKGWREAVAQACGVSNTTVTNWVNKGARGITHKKPEKKV